MRLLAEYFYDKYSTRFAKAPGIADDGYSWLESRQWPGNIRELSNFIIEAIIRYEGDDPMGRAYFESLKMQNPILRQRVKLQDIEIPKNTPLRDLVSEFERVVVNKTLDYAGSNVSQTAKILDISRDTVYHYRRIDRQRKKRLRSKIKK